MERDGLLPAVDDDEFEWLRPQIPRGATSREKVALVARWIGDVQNMVDVVWPAEIDGQLRRPPDTHLLDRLVRIHLLEGAPVEIQGEIGVRPLALTIAAVDCLPQCDRCAHQAEPESIARYDAQRKTGEWALMCPEHYRDHGTGTLGVGKGQYLIAWNEIGPRVRDGFMAAREYWIGRGVRVPDHLPWG